MKHKKLRKLFAILMSVSILLGMAPISAAAQPFETEEDLILTKVGAESYVGNDDLLGSTSAAATFVLKGLASGALSSIGGYGMDKALEMIFGPETDSVAIAFGEIKEEIKGLKSEIEKLSAKLDMLTLKNDLNDYANFNNNYVSVYDNLCDSISDYADKPTQTSIFLTNLYSVKDENYKVNGNSLIKATIDLGNRLTLVYSGNYNVFGAFDKLDRYINRWEHQGYTQRQSFRDSAIYTYAMFSTMSQLACQAVIDANQGKDDQSEQMQIDAKRWLKNLRENASMVHEMNQRCAVIQHPDLRIYRDTKKGTDLYVFRKTVEKSFSYTKDYPERDIYTKNRTLLSSKEYIFPRARTLKFNKEESANQFTLYSQQPSVTIYKKMYNDYKEDNGGNPVDLYNIFFDGDKGAFSGQSMSKGARFATNDYTWTEIYLLGSWHLGSWTTQAVNNRAESEYGQLIDVTIDKTGAVTRILGEADEKFLSPIYYYGAVEQGKLMLPEDEPAVEATEIIRGMASYYLLPFSLPVTLSVEEKAGYTCQWYVNMGDGNGYQVITGEISTTYTLPALSAYMNGYQYICAFVKDTGIDDFSGGVDQAGEKSATGEKSAEGEDTESGEAAISVDGERPVIDSETDTFIDRIEDKYSTNIIDSVSPGAIKIIIEDKKEEDSEESSTELLETVKEDELPEEYWKSYLCTPSVTLRLIGEGVAVPVTVHEVGSPEDLDAALELVNEGDWDGHTLRLTTSFEYPKSITLSNRSLTIDLNGYYLTVNPMASSIPNINPMGSEPGIAAVFVSDDSFLNIIGETENGALNINAGNGITYGVYSTGESTVQVSSVTLEEDGIAVQASENGNIMITKDLLANGKENYGVKCVDGGNVSIGGNIMISGESSTAVYAISSNGFVSNITIDGSITVAGTNSRGAYLNTENTALTVKGNLTITGGGTGISTGQGQVTIQGNVTAQGDAINAWDGAVITVHGNILATSIEGVAVSSSGANVQIGGNVTSSGNRGIGILAGDWELSEPVMGTQVTIDGFIRAATPLRIGGIPVDEGDHVDLPYKPGYLTYTDQISTVWAKPGSFAAPTLYTLTVNGNGTTASGSGHYTPGTEVSISVSERSGYNFSGWRSDNGGTFANQSSLSTIFYMPENNVTVSAIWTPIGGNSNNGSSGGSSVSGAPTPTPSVEIKPSQSTVALVSVTATSGANGTASVSILDQAITDAIAKAQSDAQEHGSKDKSITVKFNINMPQGATSLTIALTQNSINNLISAGVTSLTIKGSPVGISFSHKTLTEIQRQSTGNVSIQFTPVTKLSTKTKSMIGKRPVYNVTIGYQDKKGKGKSVTSLGNGTATLAIPYIPDKTEAYGYLFGVYVDTNGKAMRIPGSVYDSSSGVILIPTNHFSIYGVGYLAPTKEFKDISSYWAKESIEYVTSRELLSPTSNTTFSPNTAMTRGMLATALGKLAEVEVSNYTSRNFTDVEKDKYYAPYVEWAHKEGVILGISNKEFAPESVLTREEIAMIFVNYAKATGYQLPVTRNAVTFSDVSNIGSAYREAVRSMQQAGIMTGIHVSGLGYEFRPKKNATRAEVSSMIYRYVKLTIDPSTAQGWAMDDIGQYLYYKNGKVLTGTQTLDGIKYYFDTYGRLKTGWVNDGNDRRYYLGNKMVIGWWDNGSGDAKKTYYFAKDGIMVYGQWLEIDSKWYYFNDDGSLARSTKVDGYEIDDNGVRNEHQIKESIK